MQICILSDTHIRTGRTLPKIVWEKLSQVDVIVHAGDLTSPSFLEELSLLAPTYAVRGNGDLWSESLADSLVIEIGGICIGITHGYLGKGSNTLERAFYTFEQEQIDLLIFGHSHRPFKGYRNGVLLFNPGSPTDKRGQPQFSFGILRIEGDRFEVEHLFF